MRALADRCLEQARVAPLFLTTPESEVEQPDFLNTAVVGEASLQPDQLLAVAKSLELVAGRRRSVRSGPRALDIDLLLYGERVDSRPELTLPHPRLTQRRFYLEPLARIAPDLVVPPGGLSVAELLSAAPRSHAVREIAWIGGSPLPSAQF